MASGSAIRRARQSLVALPDFVPIVAESRAVPRTAAIEIEIGGAVLRADAEMLLRGTENATR